MREMDHEMQYGSRNSYPVSPESGSPQNSSPSSPNSRTRKSRSIGSASENEGRSYSETKNDFDDSAAAAAASASGSANASPEEPPEHIKDKIHFIINNVSKVNLRRKRKNLKAILKPEFYPYFSRYLVAHRVAKEANCHEVYSQLLEVSGLTKLKKQIIETTYDYIRGALSSEAITTNHNNQRALYNVGSWLGLLTFAKDRPVRAKKLPLKDLILDSFSDGRYSVIIPFVGKIVEQCALSKIFKPPNPWIMAMLAFFHEIYGIPNLPLQLAISIETIFERLAIKQSDVQATDLLKDRGPLAKRPYSDQGSQSDIPGVVINPSIALFIAYPHLRSVVHAAIERAVKEAVLSLYQRAVIPACKTTKDLILKDFAMEPDEARIRRAAHQVARSLTSSLVMVHCRDTMQQNIHSFLDSLLDSKLSAQDGQLVEPCCTQIAIDNFELCCAMVEKASAEKAIADIDAFITPFLRRRDRWQHAPYVAALPEYLRPSPDGLTAQQLQVYEDFAGYPLPATAFRKDLEDTKGNGWPQLADASKDFVPATESASVSMFQETLNELIRQLNKLEELVARTPNFRLTTLQGSKEEREVGNVLRNIQSLFEKHTRDQSRHVVVCTFAREVFNHLSEHRQMTNMVEIYLQTLILLTGLYSKLPKELTNWVLEAADATARWSPQLLAQFLKARLLSVPEVDLYLTNLTRQVIQVQADDDEGLNVDAEFVGALITRVLIEEEILRVFDFPRFFDLLSKSPVIPHALNNLSALIEKFAKGPTKDDVDFSRDPERPELSRATSEASRDAPSPEMKDLIVRLFDEWIATREAATDRAYASYLERLQQQKVLATPEKTVEFFVIITQLCVEGRPTGKTKEPQGDVGIDSLATLVVFLVKFHVPTWDETPPASQDSNASKIQLLKAFLYAACRLVRRDFEVCSKNQDNKGRVFNQRPYLLLFTKLLQMLNTPDPNLDSNNIDVLLAFGHCFRLLRPARVPSFAFAWLELTSHRMFMPKLLIAKLPLCSTMFERLLVDLFEFMQPYLRNVEMTDSIRVLYKGTLRILLVLVRDFPEFLGDFHFSFCDVIPPTCVQIRNVILAAFPRDVELPNPFTPNLKVDLSQITQPPYVASDITVQLVKQKLMNPLTSFLGKRGPTTFFQEVMSAIEFKDQKEIKRSGTKYNVPLINSLVLYVGLQGIIKLQNTTGAMAQFHDNACMDIFEHLVVQLDMEGRYYFLNAIANQLRFPNNHTHYFSCLLLHMFLQAKQAAIREQITRVLFERVICHPPHPWGLLITFIELIKNNRYAFWEQPFIKCHPEIERLFESVARICVPQGGGPGAGKKGATGPQNSNSSNSSNPSSNTSSAAASPTNTAESLGFSVRNNPAYANRTHTDKRY